MRKPKVSHFGFQAYLRLQLLLCVISCALGSLSPPSPLLGTAVGEASNPGPAGTFAFISLNISSAKAHWQTLVSLAKSYDALAIQEARLGAQA